MKKTMMFMFALGVGISFNVYAAWDECTDACETAYTACLDRGTSSSAVCTRIYDLCIDRCAST